MKESRRSEDAEVPIIPTAQYPCPIVYDEGFRSRMLDFFQRIWQRPNENYIAADFRGSHMQCWSAAPG